MTGSGLLLTLNAGSSSFKFATFHPDGAVALRGRIAPLGTTARLRAGTTDEPWPHGIEAAGLRRLLAWIDAHDSDASVSAVGHRVVHGGNCAGPVRLDYAVLEELSALIPLAPLHQPHSLSRPSGRYGPPAPA